MEDEDSSKNKKILDNIDFNVDLDNGFFYEIFKSINITLFNEDYFKILQKTDNKVEKEFYIFIRKNQHFLKKIQLNNDIIFDFRNLVGSFKSNQIEFFEKVDLNIQSIFKNEILLENQKEKNSFEIIISVLPKFKKNEINFNFSNDIMELFIKIENIEKLYSQLLSILNESKNDEENLKESKEINFIKLEQYLEIEIENLKNNNKEFKNSEIENIALSMFPRDLYNLIKNELKKIFLKHVLKYENIFLVINKFISHIENYFPLIYNKCTKLRLENAKSFGNKKCEDKKENKSLTEWEQNEQEKLEEGLRIYKDIKDTKIKFKSISELVKTKSPKECVERYKYIANLYKIGSEKSSIEKNNVNQISSSNKYKMDEELESPQKKQIQKTIVKNIKYSNEKSELIEIDNSIIILVKDDIKRKANIEKNEKIQNNNKSDVQIERTPDKTSNEEKFENKKNSELKQEEKALNLPVKADLSNLDTLDLVDQLLNQFDMNYLSIDSNLDSSKNNNLNSEKTLNNFNVENLISIPEKEESQNTSEDQLENKSEYEDENSENESMAYTGSIAKFDKNLNFTYNERVTAVHMQTILNIIRYGEKFSIQYSSVKLNRIALAEICEVNFFIKCKKCKMITFESKFIKISSKMNIFYCATICPKCKCHIQIIFKSELIHIENLQIAGITYSFGAIICDFLTSSFLINCLNCIDYNKKVKYRSGDLSIKDRVCQQCHGEMNISTQNLQIVPYSSSNYSFLEELEINIFKTNTQIIDSQDLSEYVKLYEKKIKSGSPLPENGTCKHYHHSYKWFRFDCCCKYFPCDECHNEISNHEAEWAKLVLCGFCCFEQNSSNKLCCSCGKSFTKDTGVSGFWEGGKGCRNKSQMSSKDSHKFKNSNNKTISRKKLKDMKEK